LDGRTSFCCFATIRICSRLSEVLEAGEVALLDLADPALLETRELEQLPGLLPGPGTVMSWSLIEAFLMYSWVS